MRTGFTTDDKMLLAVDEAGFSGEPHSDVFSVADGTHLRRFLGAHFSILPTGRMMSATDSNGANLIVDLSTGQELVRIIRLGNLEDWIAVTPEGLFDGTETARKTVAFRIGDSLELVPVDRFFQDYYRPGLLAEIFAGGRPLPGGEFAGQRAPLVRVTSPKQDSELTDSTVEIACEITDRGGGIKPPRLMQNGARVLAEGTETLTDKTLKKTFTAGLIEGDNRFEVCSASADGSWESEPAVLVLRHAKPAAKPALHLVAVGINRYSDETMNLKLAAPDAESIVKLFNERGPALYGQGQVHTVSLLDENATQEAIRKTLAQVASKANPQDTLLVFLGGHGTTLGQRYYFITHEFQAHADSLEEDIRTQGLAGDVLGDLLARVPALKRVVIFDTCQSSSVLSVQRTARDPFAFRGALERLSRSQGCFTIAAAAATAQAHEIDQLGHGLLTYALLAGSGTVDTGPLAGQTAQAHDKLLDVRDWFSFAQDKIPHLAKLYLGEEQFVGFSGQGNSFPILPMEK